jgi:hypothetical protein
LTIKLTNNAVMSVDEIRDLFLKAVLFEPG